ncbi:exodeoxyribonuclease VII small subunit [Altericista sp. CCNU0014]|uniref:exodeoxyribonuclease VII small subunit n=1 Tax=Altericista sp. CCNU0014 TaxID=3082949 RepID=UPI003851705E
MPKKSEPQPQPSQRPDHWHYETSVAEIETIISRIESGELELEDVFEQFARAVESLGQCEAFLTERQSQIELLIETLGDLPSS